MDFDGDIDIVRATYFEREISWFRNDGGDPIVWTIDIIDTFFTGAWPGYLHDIDGDADQDILAVASFSDKLAWWESDLNDKPEKPEKPAGPTSGKPETEYTFSTLSNDIKNEQI
jgi:hypothetical protein